MDPAILTLAVLATRQCRAAVRNYRGSTGVGGINAIVRGAAEVFDDLDPLLQTLTLALASNGLPRAQLRETNQIIAKKAQEYMVTGMRATLPVRAGPYRPQDRLTGTLEQALADPVMTEGTTDRVISFINTNHLDKAARHWYRVNYGVQGELTQGPSREAKTITIMANGQALATLRDPNPPRPGGNYLPRSFRFHGNQMMEVRGAAKPQSDVAATRGSRAAHFTDLGLATVGREIGPAYTRLLRWYVNEKRSQKVMARREIIVPDLRILPDAEWRIAIR